ncbi:MAG: Efflux ABC transporter, ATP-binding protein [uncultured Gemmatimonadetes bacterium]|uniref:Efflux ABC transporter, ATP-binding protein n=1 Tax=uncultured Gemmatimonadota bacterium TaxID=203437 RepID=A0A6J4KJU2_9BACT|nr:MAG: Efflux ABC transporter, ATP-binding protein [uncultured Gemmatimonadota bacterium]
MSSPSSPVRGPALRLRALGKTYRVHEREPGVAAAFRSLFRRTHRDVHAVSDLSFDVAEGEVVGFLGPNGAGKTTTIKMLSGLLYPTTGEARVLGEDPWRRSPDFLRQITLIMGRRNQLIWDVPAIESFEFFRAIYSIPRAEYKSTLDDLVDLMELRPLLHKPVRNLSLGERMKLELTGALLHRPRVLFLDEPTIGLDVLAQDRFRRFIADYNRRYDATVLLTSHYMGDVEELCSRVIFIDDGKLVYDGSLKGLVEQFLPYKTIEVQVGDAGVVDFQPYGDVMSQDGGRAKLRVSKADTPAVVSRLLADLEVRNLDIADPPTADLVRFIYTRDDVQP